MFIKYLIEKKSWIIFIICLQLLQLFIASIDNSVSLSSTIYITFLSILLFLIFLFFRYQKETVFYESLSKREDDLDVSSLPKGNTPFEKITEESFRIQMTLLKKDILQSNQMMEQEKDELLSWIHEVKTPLTALHLLIENLESPELKGQLLYEWLRIHLLLDQQLHQKRIPFIENDLYIEKVEIEPIIYDELKNLQTWCIQKGIGFEMNLEITHILTDGKWLAFIIRQLLTNAIKYSSQSDIFITSYEKNGQAFLEVKDQGIGIDIKDISRIFEKGFTSTSTHQNNYATGMGLYLTKKIADALQVSIHVDSIVNTGTTFTLLFPKRNLFDQVMNEHK